MATTTAFSRAASAPRRRTVPASTVALGAITLGALALRFATLTEQSYWVDEAYTVHLVRLGLGPMLSTIPRTESTPPLYYVLAWLWTHVFDAGEFGLRSLSALAGTGVVLLGGLIARRVSGAPASLVAAALLAVSPFLVWFSQEARAYALATLLSAGGLLCLIGYAQCQGRGRLAGWTLCAALALCTHYFTAFVILPGAVWLLWRRRRDRGVLVALTLVTLAAAALVPLALAQRGTGHADYIAQGALGTRLLQIPKQLVVGYASPTQALTSLLAVVLLLAGLARALLRRPWPHTAAGRLILATPLTGVLVPAVLALIGIDFLDTRNLLPVLPALAVLAATGFTTPAAGRWGRCCAAGLLAVFAVVVVLVDTTPAYQRIDWRGAVRAVGPVSGTRVVVVAPSSSTLPVQAFAPNAHLLTHSVAVSELDLVNVPGGDAPLPPAAPIRVSRPAGFHLRATVLRRGYSVALYRAASPVALSLADLAALPVGNDRVVLLETPGPR